MFWSPTIERLPVEELKRIQEKKLKNIVRNAYEYSPFYKRKFRELGIHPTDVQSLRDLIKLPFTKKQDLRDNYPFGMFAVPIS
ncbi:MAG: phenylacetate--CoA ligase, partial [Archaeoglobaceae archaeon]|nr:phenylacetate--CoA ligase [Archaeoglobaceae archaeon]MDW8118088.1 phenylacetate--CoA ligase [Archaeoglobaceae archaeon]